MTEETTDLVIPWARPKRKATFLREEASSKLDHAARCTRGGYPAACIEVVEDLGSDAKQLMTDSNYLWARVAIAYRAVKG
jgi:hypothetical protein